jgi:hypothetical protein
LTRSNRASHYIAVRGERQEAETLWRLRLELAQQRYRNAAAATGAAVFQHPQLPSPDSNTALEKALREEKAALAEYRRVLRIFAGLVVNGTMPPEEVQSHIGCPPDKNLQL